MLMEFKHFAFSIFIWRVQESLWSKVKPRSFKEVCGNKGELRLSVRTFF